MTWQYYLAYLSILLIATISPGPSMLLAINHGACHGIKKTIFSGLGNSLGNLIMALVSIAGLGALLLASGILFNIIKWIGILYLIYIGTKLIFEPVKTDASEKNNFSQSSKTLQRLFIDGFVIAIGNPKGILFFTALFPQFINIETTTRWSFGIVFITLRIIAFSCFMLYASLGSRINKLLHLYSFRKMYNRVSGSIFIGTGLAIAFTKK
jgi:threonine/homoserine/homoserine lactone efflux protein